MTLLGYLTWYLLLNQPLRCGGTYLESSAWIAMDIDAGHARCGDIVTIISEDGTARQFTVLDSGPLSKYCVKERDGSCVPIIGDMPKHGVWWEGLSTKVTIINETMGTRTRETSNYP